MFCFGNAEKQLVDILTRNFLLSVTSQFRISEVFCVRMNFHKTSTQDTIDNILQASLPSDTLFVKFRLTIIPS